jgi:hypothetical protein
MKNIVYTSIILVMGFLLAQASEPLGDLARLAQQNGVLFSDGRTTLSGTLSNADGMLAIDGANATVKADGLILNLMTSDTEDDLKALMENGEIRRWNGGAEETAYLLRNGRLIPAKLTAFDPATHTGNWTLIKLGGELYVFDRKQA